MGIRVLGHNDQPSLFFHPIYTGLDTTAHNQKVVLEYYSLSTGVKNQASNMHVNPGKEDNQRKLNCIHTINILYYTMEVIL